MAWQLQFDPAAEKELGKLDKAVQRTVKKFLAEVCDLQDPASRGHTLSHQLAGQHTYRIGQPSITSQHHNPKETGRDIGPAALLGAASRNSNLCQSVQADLRLRRARNAIKPRPLIIMA